MDPGLTLDGTEKGVGFGKKSTGIFKLQNAYHKVKLEGNVVLQKSLVGKKKTTTTITTTTAITTLSKRVYKNLETEEAMGQ